MWRFLLPATILVGAVLALLAGATGDQPLAPRLSSILPVTMGGTDRAVPPPTASSDTATQPEPAGPGSPESVAQNDASTSDTKPLTDQPTADQVAADNVASSLAGTDPTTDDKPPSDPTATYQPAPDRIAGDDGAAGPTAPGQSLTGINTPGQAPTDSGKTDQAGQNADADQALAAKAASGNSKTESSEADKAELAALRQQLASLEGKVGDLTGQVKQRSDELATLRGNTDQARNELASLQQQRQAATTALQQLQTEKEKAAAQVAEASRVGKDTMADRTPARAAKTNTTASGANQQDGSAAAAKSDAKQSADHAKHPVVTADSSALKTHDAAPAGDASPPGGAPHGTEHRSVADRSAAVRPSSASPPRTATRGAGRSGGSGENDHRNASVPPAVRLMGAREALAGGRVGEARELLALAQTQTVFNPVTPHQPVAEGGNPMATAIDVALRWLDRGDTWHAVQAINYALDHTANAREREVGWSDASASNRQVTQYQPDSANERGYSR